MSGQRQDPGGTMQCRNPREPADAAKLWVRPLRQHHRGRFAYVAITSFKRMDKRVNFRQIDRPIAAQEQRPDAGVD
jgi:hypothetical protein